MSMTLEGLKEKKFKAVSYFPLPWVSVITLEWQDHKKGGVQHTEVQLNILLAMDIIEQWYALLIVNSYHYKRQRFSRISETELLYVSPYNLNCQEHFQ